MAQINSTALFFFVPQISFSTFSTALFQTALHQHQKSTHLNYSSLNTGPYTIHGFFAFILKCLQWFNQLHGTLCFFFCSSNLFPTSSMALLSTAFLTPIRLHQHHNSSFKCSSCTHGSLRKFNISDSFLPSQLSSTIQWQSTPRHFFKHTNTPTLSNYSSLQLRSMHNSIPCTHGSVCKIQFMVLPISFPTSSTALFFQTAPSNLFLLYPRLLTQV
jgi:hypothetical protein